MSFAKASELLRLADFAAARHRGITLRDITGEFGVSHRTAQRMTAALRASFPHAVEVADDPATRERRWQVRGHRLAALQLRGDAELEALDMAAARLTADGDQRQAEQLRALRDRLMAALPSTAARRAEADAEALLEAHGTATRPGPRVEVARAVADAITDALRGPWRLAMTYGGVRRLVEPYGVLLGARRYLVARQPDRGPVLRHFRIDSITDPVVTAEWFARDAGFRLDDHAARAFGSYHDAAEFGEVVWRFAPQVADRAAEWRFHPTQTARRLPDGGLEVRFTACGWLEMTWHLYQWGDAVEVLAPSELAEMVHSARRGDFPAQP